MVTDVEVMQDTEGMSELTAGDDETSLSQSEVERLEFLEERISDGESAEPGSEPSESEHGFVLLKESNLLDWLKSEKRRGNLDGATDFQIRPPSKEWVEAEKRKRGLE